MIINLAIMVEHSAILVRFSHGGIGQGNCRDPAQNSCIDSCHENDAVGRGARSVSVPPTSNKLDIYMHNSP